MENIPPPRTNPNPLEHVKILWGIYLKSWGLSPGITLAVIGIILNHGTYLIYILGDLWAQSYPSDDTVFDAVKTVFELPIYIAMCLGLLMKRTWAWWLTIVWIGIPHLPLNLAVKQYAIAGLFYNLSFASLVTLPYLYIGQPASVLSFVYLVSNHRIFNK